MDYFRTSLQDAAIPALNGTVISREPGILKIAMADAATPDVQLKLYDEVKVLVPMFPEGSRLNTDNPTIKPSRDTVEDMIHDWREHGWLKAVWVQRPAPPRSARDADPPVGAHIEFEGSVTDFTPYPFTLTFNVKRSDIRIVESKN